MIRKIKDYFKNYKKWVYKNCLKNKIISLKKSNKLEEINVRYGICIGIIGLAEDLGIIGPLKGTIKYNEIYEIAKNMEAIVRYNNFVADKADELKTAKSEAIKEFAENLKVKMQLEDDCDFDCNICMYECKEYVPLIDELVKEMTEVKE